jgi:3-dehydroquinate dehydratase
MELRVDQLEKAMGTQDASSSTAVAQVKAQEECATTLDVRLDSLEKVSNTQAQAAILFDIRA